MDRLNPPLNEFELTSHNTRLTLTVPEPLLPGISEKGRGGFAAPSTPQTRGRSRTFSQLATSIISPSSEKPAVDVAASSNLTSSDSVKPDKAHQETRKLLGHILHELQNRPLPPSVVESLHLGQGAQRSGSQPFIRKATRRLGSGHASRSGSLPLADGDSDSDEGFDSTFSPEFTFELLNKLRDVLILAKMKSWQIFEDDANVDRSEKPSFRLRGSSFNTGARRARSFSPNRSKVSSVGLLGRCLGILSWIVLEDCRYQIKSIRLSRPPNALQALTLDIWIVLIHMHRGDSKVLHDIALAAIPAFSTFPKSMHRRLFLFFERVLLQTMLLNLRGLQNATSASKAVTENQAEYENQLNPPIVAIQVDEAKDDDMTVSNLLENSRRWLPPNSIFSGTVSSYAPSQPMEVYFLAHVVPPLLVAILDNVDLLTQDADLSYHLKAFFSFLAEYKCDAAIDLLQIAAYCTTQARRSAIALLLSYWQKAFGHISITKPFPLPTSSEALEKSALNRAHQDGIHQHQFMPWHFNPAPSSAFFEGSSFHDCHSCNRQITTFGLLCPFCMCAVHINCYDAPGGSQLSHYPVADEPSTQRVAVHRFSYVRLENSCHELRDVKKGQHAFRLVNIFTLSLCCACRRPLWGYVEQGYRCWICNQYVHRSCMHEETLGRLASCHSEQNTRWITINWSDLRTSFVEFYREIILQEEDVARCSYEELSIYWSFLWMQLQLLKYGIASGSIIVVRDRSSSSEDSQTGVDNFELQHLEKLFDAYLASDRLQMSPMTGDVLQKNRYPRQFRLMLFDWPILLYVTSVARSPLLEEDDVPNESLLSAGNGEAAEDFDVQPAEVVSLAHLQDVLRQQFGLHKPQAACILLGHLRHLGFFDNADIPGGFFTSDISAESMCHFPLPSGLDISATVEFLITAVEACFEDLDVSVNESGFLLLVRRLWPNGMFSDYALSRLIKAVVSWILSEDDNLVIILREYVAKNRNLPGVPSTNESHSWPNKYQSRSASSGSVNNGNDYVACRKNLLEKYATRWLFAVHSQNPDVYASLIFGTVSDLAMESYDVDIASMYGGTHENKETLSLCADKVLRSIMKLCQCSIAFSIVDDLFLKWLEVFPSKLSPQKPLATLPRLFNREAEGTTRWTSAFDATITSFDHISAPLSDPWRVVIDVAARDYDGLRNALDWLCIFASSGVDIPVNTFLQVSALTRDLNAPFEDHLKLSRAAFMAIWLKSLGRQDLHRMISDLHDRHVACILSELEENSNAENIYTFFRLTLSSFLLLYGCDRSRLQDLGLITSDDTEGLSRRKAVKRASLVTDPDIEDIDFIDIIFRYVEEGTDELRCLITKFLVCFVTESSLLSAPELEAMILRNSFYLTRWAWKIYDMQTSEVNDIRATLLLRILVVDTSRFDELLAEYFSEANDWEKRLSAASRLFQVVLDVTKPSFSVEGRQWRSNVVQIFYRFFAASWSCDREEIRLAIDAWAQTLQPAHQESMTRCFSEVLARAPVTERLELVSFLLQLRPHFPSWKVLTWDTIIETLMDDEFMLKTNADESAITAHLSMYGISSTQQVEAVRSKDPDMSALQGSLLLLSLQMIADGVSIDIFSYLKIKMQLVGLIGFPGATLVPAPSGHSFHVQFGELKTLNTSALPCLQGMMSLLDAYRLFDLAPSGMTASGAEDDTTYPVLIGSVVLDVFLGLFQYLLDNVSDFPYPQIKLMLQSLSIVIYKHDVEVVPLRHLREIVRKVVKRATSLLLKDIGSESKQLVLTTVQAYRKRWLNYASSRDFLVNQLTDIINFISSSTAAKDDFLVGQAIAVLEDIFMSHSGAFYNLSKQPLSEETFSVLRLVTAKNARNVDAQAPLPDIILRDTLQILVSIHNDPGRKHTLENLKLFVEIVYHQGYTPDSLTSVGESIVSILRSASELSEEAFDPSPLLLAVATLVQYNKAQVRGLLHHLESAVRIALVRFDTTEQAVRRLLQVTSTLFRRTASEPGASAQERNVILVAIIDVLSDGLRAKCRVTPATLKAIVNSLCHPRLNYISSGSLGRLGNDALFYLQNSTSLDLHSEHSLSASRAASLLLIIAESKDRGLLYRYLSENAYERTSRHTLSIRAWNALALESLECNSEVKPALQLFENFASFSTIYQISLRAHSQTVGLPPDMTASEINQAYIAIKLWLLLARKCAEEVVKAGDDTTPVVPSYTSEERNASLIWNELWPPFERLLALSETDVEMGDLTPIETLVWSSIADILLFLRLMRSTIFLESASHAAILNRIKTLAKGESSSSKFARTLKSISELPPEVPLASLVAQTTQELLAAEKLHALETRRDLGRMIPDRSRRDLRMQTG